MADETFSYKVKAAPAGSESYAVLRAKFGDGYGQVAGDGIAKISDAWQIEVIGVQSGSCGTLPDIDQVKSFLDRHAGCKAFNWLPPIGPAGEYYGSAPIIKKVSGRYGAGKFMLSSTFTRKRGYDIQ